jgi:Protein of unknown function (DUF1631)
MSPAPPRDPKLISAVRDAMVETFAAALSEGIPAMIEVLEQQLAQTQDRDKWRPLREGIELLQVARATLHDQVAAAVAKRFDAKLNPSDDAFGKTAKFSLDSLSLVADDQIQEEIALGTATKRLKDQSGDEFFALTQRLIVVMGVETLPDDRNPAYARVFARGVLDAFEKSSTEGVSRLAVFAAAGPVMLQAVPEAYKEGNRLLKAHNVLPNLTKSYGAPVQVGGARSAPSATRGAASGATGAGASGAASAAGAQAAPLGVLERLFAAAARPAAAPVAAAPASIPGLVTIQVRPELVAALRALEARHGSDPVTTFAPQAMHFEAPAPAAHDADAPAAAMFSASIVRRAKVEMSDSLTPADAVVADLVAALFERLFVDPRLSDATKAQVGRLQLPVFKSVMQDRMFFTDAAHPIRALIDAMAEMGAVEPGAVIDEHPPGEWIAGSVAYVLARNADDPAAFAKSAKRLSELLEKHREQVLEHDEHVKTIVYEEKRLDAIQEASLVIAHRLAAGNYSDEVPAFVHKSWRSVLIYDHLDAGSEGADWKTDLETLDDLLWSMKPHSSKEERARLVSLLPSMLYRMKLGFLRAGFEPEQAEAYLEELKELHAALARAPAAAAHGAQLGKTPATPPHYDDFTATLHVSSGALTEEGFKRGAWIEFTEPDGMKHRCRLNWMSPVQGTCVFKDLERNKSFAISVGDLRERQRAGTALIVDGPGIAQASIEGAISDVARDLGAAPG